MNENLDLTYGKIVDTSWNAMKSQLALLAGLTLVWFLGVGSLSFIPAVGWMLSGPFTAGYIKALLRIRAKETIDFKDIFWGFLEVNRFIHLVLVSFLTSALTIVGLICLIIPGIYLAVATILSTQILVLQGTDSVESIKRSINIVKGRWWWFLGFFMLMAVLNLIGAAFFLIGIFITIPLTNYMLIVLVEAVSKEKGYRIEGDSAAKGGSVTETVMPIGGSSSVFPVNPNT